MANPLALGASAALGLASGIFGGGDDEEVSTLNPQQQAVMKALGPALISRISQGPQQFGGQLTAPITPGEIANINRFNRLAALSEGTLSGLINIDEPKFRQDFRTEVVDPAFRDFRQNVAPIIEESLPSFSTARGKVIGREAGNLSRRLLNQRFLSREEAKNRALQAIGRAESLGTTGFRLNAIPREIEQLGLDRQFANFFQANQQFQDQINSGLQFLGIQTKAIRPTDSFFDRVVSGLGAGARIGALVSGFGQDTSSPENEDLT